MVLQLDKRDYLHNSHVVFCPDKQRFSFFNLFVFGPYTDETGLTSGATTDVHNSTTASFSLRCNLTGYSVSFGYQAILNPLDSD